MPLWPSSATTITITRTPPPTQIIYIVKPYLPKPVTRLIYVPKPILPKADTRLIHRSRPFLPQK